MLVKYPARVVPTWNSSETGTIATVKLELLHRPRNAKKQTVRYVEYF